MSHNTAGIAPHVLSFTPSAFAAAGAATITVNGTKLSTTCKLSMPSALGTVVSGPVLSNVSSSQADATWQVNILATTDVTYTCTVSNGGLAASGVSIDIFHGFDPSDLLNNDGMYYSSTDTTKHQYNTGTDLLLTWDPTSGISTPVIFPSNYTCSGAPFSTANSTPAAGWQGSATSFNTQYGFQSSAFAFTAGGVSAWSVGFVVELTSASLSSTDTLHIYGSAHWSVGFANNTFFADQRYSNNGGNSGIIITGITTPGVYTVIATQDGAAANLTLAINGVDSGLIASGQNGKAVAPTTATTAKIISLFQPAAIIGDVFMTEKKIEPGDVANLHAYWAAKFIN